MSFSLGQLFGNLFSHSSEVATDASQLLAGFEATYTAIAHGEGGIQKVSAALTQATGIVASLSKILADATTSPPPPPAA
jgi:hypothetical protein